MGRGIPGQGRRPFCPPTTWAWGQEGQSLLARLQLRACQSAAYAIISNIDYIEEECPFSKGATSIRYREVLNSMESGSAGYQSCNSITVFCGPGRRVFSRTTNGPRCRCAKSAGRPPGWQVLRFLPAYRPGKGGRSGERRIVRLEAMMKPIYLDYNATTPAKPGSGGGTCPTSTGDFGNPSSGHPYGRKAREAVELARERMAALLGCDRSEVIFTGGGTEANNLALIGVALANQERGKHIISTTIEHPAVLKPLGAAGRAGLFGYSAARRRDGPGRPRGGSPGHYPRHHTYKRNARQQRSGDAAAAARNRGAARKRDPVSHRRRAVGGKDSRRLQTNCGWIC